MSKTEKHAAEQQKARKARNRAVRVVSLAARYILFVLILTALAAVYLIGQQDDRPRVVFGHTVLIVLSGSMQSEIQQGSLLISKVIEPDMIQIGDNITFLNENNKLITHKVVDIIEDYDQSGMRGFVTKGVNNSSNDRDVVFEDNVVGKVVFHNEWMGPVLSYIKDRFWLVALMTVLISAFVSVLLRLFRSRVSVPVAEKTEHSRPLPTQMEPDTADDKEVEKTTAKKRRAQKLHY